MVAVLDTHSGKLLGRTTLDTHGHIADFTDAPSAQGASLPHDGQAALGVVDERRGRAFFVNSDGPVVSVLDTRSGRLLVTATLGPTSPPIRGEALGTVPALLALAAPTGDIVVTNPKDGSISLLDGATATPRQTIAVGGPPIEMLVDERHGTTLVITLNGRISILQRPASAPPSLTFACAGSLHVGVGCHLAGHGFRPAAGAQITYHIAVGSNARNQVSHILTKHVARSQSI
jgi:DNA-binding beta-propeller fold protein YncE